MKFLLFSLTSAFFLLLKSTGQILSTTDQIVPVHFWGEFKKNTQVFKDKSFLETLGLTPGGSGQFSQVISTIKDQLKTDEFDPESLTRNLDILLNVSQYKKDSISAIDYINLLSIIEEGRVGGSDPSIDNFLYKTVSSLVSTGLFAFICLKPQCLR